MSGSFEKSVKGATKIKAAAPKTKYIEHILVATHSGEAGVGEIFRVLSFRLRDSTWTVVFKSLITVHLMIREGSPDATLSYLAHNRNLLSVTTISDAQTQGRNIRVYANYLQERAKAYRDTKCDWVRTKETRLEKLTVDKGLLRETECVQRQVTALLRCDLMDNEISADNEIQTTAFRLLVLDLLALFQVLNQAMINILGNFFEMSKPDAERALEIYRQFAKQTDFVVSYLRVARQFEHHTRVEVPKLKHAPVNLKQQLEDYVNDPDFEVNRRQYIAEVQAKKSGGTVGASKSTSSAFDSKPAPSSSFPEPKTAPAQSKPVAAKAPAADLIDFFGSIEQAPAPAPQAAPQQQQQVPMQTGFAANGQLQQQQQLQQQATGFQQNGFNPQQTFSTNPYQTQQGPSPPQNLNPWGQPQQPQPLQPSFTGAGFGGFSPQPTFTPGALGSIPQDNVASFQTGMQNTLQTPQTTNPFRASMMLQQQQTGMQPTTTMSAPTSPPNGLQRQSTNPFARSSSQPQQGQQAFGAASGSPFQGQVQSPPQATPAPLVPMATGTNPFAKNFGGAQLQQRPATSAGPLAPQATGTTNPFRQASFVNHQTGLGWQHNQQPIGGGLDQLQTTPVFPRPAQQTPWQQ
ncbi:ENTH domain-containing protein [Plectosphaerella cucumerina]|uniref:ENTH domain-containing protein n=1 Tax=Plectosphaerella cucumerina TaxID=40658 RepID=A0A8K0TUH9_9PEZI|nr:ENTH domain-containing protein [Plectosphaerella cucumerina]